MSETHFGFATVPLDDKQRRVDDLFRTVARRYDLMNDLMSFGLHRAWKDALVTAVNPPKGRPFALLDIAGGTGDVALRALAAGGERTRATVCDINADMLAVGRERAAEARDSGRIGLCAGWRDDADGNEANARHPGRHGARDPAHALPISALPPPVQA